MAEVPYTGEFRGNEGPDTLPDNYQRANVSPDMFGAQIGEGMQEVGAALGKTAQFYNQVRADDSWNQSQKQIDALLYGDPSKTVTNPDGSVTPVPGFFALKGRDALNQAQVVQQQIDKIIADGRNKLGDGVSQYEYDTISRRTRSSIFEKIGAHTAQQTDSYALNVNGAAADNALNSINLDPANDKSFEQSREALRQAYVKTAQLQGTGDIGYTDAIAKADRDAWTRRIQTIGVNDPVAARDMAEANKAILGQNYDNLANSLRERADSQIGSTAAQGALTGTMSGTTPPVVLSDPTGAKAYLSSISSHPTRPGDTSNLAPAFSTRLAGALREARANGLDLGLMSGYRSPNETTSQGRNDSASRYDAAGFSLHDKGAAADISGLDGPNGPKTMQWAKIAAKWGIYNPYGTGNANELNHWQAVNYKLEDRPDVLNLVKSAGADQTAIWRAIEGPGGQGQAGAPSYPKFSLSAMTQAVIGQESNGNPNVGTSVDGAMGPGQIMPDTFKRFALPGEDINVPADNEKVAGRIIQSYAQKYGNDPARIAVAYFSGEGNVAPPGSATPYITDKKDGNGKSVSSYVADVLNRYGVPTQGVPTFVATNAGGVPGVTVPNNGSGTPDIMAFQGGNDNSIAAPFTAGPEAPEVVKTPSFDQVAASPEMRKAAAYQAIQERTDLTDQQKEKAYQAINQQIQQEMIIQQATEKAKNEANDKAADGYVKRILGGDVQDIVPAIVSDPNLKWETREHLVDAAAKFGGANSMASMEYGKGFWDAYKGVTAPPGDPSRISDVNAILSRVGPNGDLTLEGASKLIGTIGLVKKDAATAAVMTTKAGLMNYAKSKLSFDQTMTLGGQPMKDPVGEAIFNSQFIPKFEAAFDTWMQAGKDPFQFLTKQTVDDMARDLRDPFAMAAARVSAQIQSGDQTVAQNVPPVPDKSIEPKFWNEAAVSPPISGSSGQPMASGRWVTSLTQLLKHPELAPQFDEAMARGGYDYRAKNIFAVHDAAMKESEFGPYARAPQPGESTASKTQAPPQPSPPTISTPPAPEAPDVFSFTR